MRERHLTAVEPASGMDVTAVRPQPGPVRLAVVDDDSGFVRVLAKRADEMGWHQRVLTVPPRPEELLPMRLHAVVLDLALAGDAAWDYLESLCATLSGVGIVICTGPSSVAQRVRGLRLGADDWITKPCHPQEVIARVEAVVRRHRRAAASTVPPPPLVAGELTIRADQFQAFVGGQSVDLTRREFELLELLANARGQVLEREAIYQRVWGYAMVRGDRSVDVFIRKLRQKVERLSPSFVYIHTHFGVGYKFDPVPLDEAPEVAPPAGGLPPVE